MIQGQSIIMVTVQGSVPSLGGYLGVVRIALTCFAL